MKAKIYLVILFLALAALANAQDKQRCKATTKAGTACKAYRMDKQEFCRVHSPSSFKCGTIKADKKACKNPVGRAGDKCHYHND